MEERSIHDNLVVAYEVDAERRRIVLHTRFEARDPFEYTDLIFEGVYAYHFENDNFGSILFGVEEVPVLQLLASSRNLFEAGSKYAWPGPWNKSINVCGEYLQAKGAKAFEISSAYGLCGWVIAKTYRLEAGSGKRAV